MTDLTPDPLDELVSAHLDGATTPEEDARIAADPALQARVAALGAVRAAVSGVPAAEDATRDANVAAVLTRLDEGATVTPLAPVGRHGAARTWRIVAAAAAVVAVAVLIPLLANRDDSSTQDAASSGTSASTRDGKVLAEPPANEESAGSAGAAAPSTTAAGRLTDLGDFASVAALETALDAAPQQETTAFGADSAADASAPPCAAAMDQRSAVPLGTARIDSRPVLVAVYADGTRLLILDAGACTVVADAAR